MTAKWWFSKSNILSVFISWLSTVRNIFPFFTICLDSYRLIHVFFFNSANYNLCYIYFAAHVVPLVTSSHFPYLFQNSLFSEAWSSLLRPSEHLTSLCALVLWMSPSLHMFLFGYFLVSISILNCELEYRESVWFISISSVFSAVTGERGKLSSSLFRAWMNGRKKNSA